MCFIIHKQIPLPLFYLTLYDSVARLLLIMSRRHIKLFSDDVCFCLCNFNFIYNFLKQDPALVSIKIPVSGVTVMF